MENSKSEELISGLVTAFIDQSGNSNLAYRPEFVYNDHKQGKKVLVSLEQELKRCDEFFISVAFITDSGFESLSMILKELEQKGIPGKILTTDYLTFSQPKALDRLAQLKNIELKMFRTNSEVGGFHTKGYIFREDELYRIIIGSSNMTSKAITENREWNTKIVSTEQGEVAQEILNEFKNLWMSPNSQYYEEFIEDYKEQYLQNQIIKKQQRQAAKEQIVDFESYKLKPNKMQLAFINNLMEMRSEGIEKALLLSSTGTGKTYASAFAVRELGYQKVLFLVHRNQIAEQALKSYQKVFGPSVTMGLVTGKSHDYGADFIFATVQTLSKTENLERFARDHFECCIYDEAHHTSADSYKKVMDYFTPQFTLGMTATPDKRDDHIEGRNIYEIFDHNIAYEIRLQKAGIHLDQHGWAEVDELIKGVSKTHMFNMEILEEIVRTDNKQRYSFNEDKTKIRANQGHSIPVDVELKEAKPPKQLWHGTGEKYVSAIDEQGLLHKNRLYVHLSTNEETAIKVGKRHGKPVLYTVNAEEMYQDGYKFFLSKNGVWLTDQVPVKYLDKYKN